MSGDPVYYDVSCPRCGVCIRATETFLMAYATEFNCIVSLEDRSAIASACLQYDEVSEWTGIKIGQDLITSGRCMCPEVARVITDKMFEHPKRRSHRPLSTQLTESRADFELASHLAERGEHASAIGIYSKLIETEESDDHAQFFSGMMLSCEQTGRADLISSLLSDPRFYKHLKSRDAIKMTLRWSAKLKMPVDDNALLSAIHSTGALTAPEVVDELAFYVLNWSPRDISLAEPYIALLQTGSYGRSACWVIEHFLAGKIRDLLLDDRFMSDREAVESVANSIAERRSFSMVRLGDGEGNILAHWLYPQNEFLGHLAERILRHMFLNAMLPVAEYAELFADFRLAIEQADLLGVPTSERIDYEFAKDVRGFWGVYFAAIYCCTQIQPRQFISPSFVDQLFRSPEIISGLRGAKAINTISCHTAFGPRVRQRLGVTTGIDLTVPGEMAMSILPEETRAGRHYPDKYQQVLKRIAQFEPGSVILVAAGICGKVYAHYAKLAGCCALDIGAFADLVMGYYTRPIFTQPSYRALFAEII